MTNPFLMAVKTTQNGATTLNGAKSNASTLDATLDYFGKCAALRSLSDNSVIHLFTKSFYEDKALAMRTLFYSRDIRNGQGERKSFRTIIKWLAMNGYGNIVLENFANIVEFGRWDDFYELVGTPIESEAFNFIAAQLIKDVENMREKKPISLAAKWLKSVNTSSGNSRSLGHLTAKHLNVSHKTYRKALSALRAYIGIVEQQMSNNQWQSIDFAKVPSKAGLQYRKAFSKKATDKYLAFLKDVKDGKVKINASVLYPYEIIRPIFNGTDSNDETLDALWKAQPNWIENNPHKGFVMADTSGSMNGLPILVSLSLAIYFAERNVGPFKNHFMTFSKKPKLHKISGDTISEKVNSMDRSGWDQNTDLIAAFELILKSAIDNELAPTDLPDTLYIISDMQFDTAADEHTNLHNITTKFTAAGYVRPNIVFWNVNSINTDYPITINDAGVCLVSGCNPSILKAVLSAKSITPIDMMMEVLNNPRYDVIKI
jgi:hypothetical protein